MEGTSRRRPPGHHTSGRARQLLVVLAFAVAGIVAGRLAVLALDGDDVPGAVRTATVERPTAAASGASAERARGSPAERHEQRGLVRAVRVLHAWDADRAVAYARGDPAALRGLYLPGSRAGERDVRVLRAYAERGLVLRGLRTQVLALDVARSTPRRLVLQVTDRRVGGRAVTTRGPTQVLALPRDAPSARVLALHQWHGRWRVAAVSDR